MTPRERLQTVLDRELPDKVPHFELVFQLEQEAFGLSWPTEEEVGRASVKEREAHLERYEWCAAALPVSFHGHYDGEVIARGRKRFSDRVMIYSFNGQGTFWMPTGEEMMDFVVKLFDEPQRVHEEAKVKMADSIELARRQVDQGVDFICINSDYGYNQGPFISPEMFAEFVTPYLEQIVGSLLQEVDEQRIRASVRYAMTHGKRGGGFIFSTSNCVFHGMPLESYHIMLDEYERHASYGAGGGHGHS